MSKFEICKTENFSRLGKISTSKGVIQTPALFPVVAFIGGTTPKSGGLWRYLRDHVFKTELPILSETTHFLNFDLSPKSFINWKEKTFHEWFEDFKTPLFLDSGGFQLLNNKEFDLTPFNFTISPKDILDLQLAFGGEIIATLDYPLPPNLKNAEAKRRIHFTITNAIETLRLLEERGDDHTKVYVPIHGRDGKEITSFINNFVRQFNRSGVKRAFNGFAVGSLVPLRSSPEKIIEILIAVKNTLRRRGLDQLPLHVFGVGSTLIPLLVYLGIDSFDNSTYVQQARSLKYANPETWSYHKATQLNEITCTCNICQSISLAEMKEILTSEISFKPIKGRFKSEFYAYIAMHNLNVHLGALHEAKQALKGDYLEDYLVEFTKKRVRRSTALECMAINFESLRIKLGTKAIAVKNVIKEKSPTLSLNYKSKDFKIPDKYEVPEHHKILFFFPCSKEKPYSSSQTFKKIFSAVGETLNGTSKKIHYVVISGLYGPVPIEYDSRPETTNYDFVLTFRNHAGVERVAEQISKYVSEYGESFDYIVACAPSKPYRKAIEKGLIKNKNAVIFPKKNSKSTIGKNGQFYQALEQCLSFLKDIETVNHDT